MALEPFYFCESVEIATPLAERASSLKEFRSSLEIISHASLYYHFIASRSAPVADERLFGVVRQRPGADPAGRSNKSNRHLRQHAGQRSTHAARWSIGACRMTAGLDDYVTLLGAPEIDEPGRWRGR
jgi:hypothetical protein